MANMPHTGTLRTRRISALRWRCGGSIGHLPPGAHSWVLVNPNPILLLSANVRTAGVPLVQTSSLKSWNLRQLVPWLRGKVVAPRSLSETKQCLILISQHERKRPVCPRFPQSSNHSKSANNTGKTGGGKGGLRRPYIRKSTREEVEAKAIRTKEGKPIDPNTKEPIDGKPDLGHKAGNEHWREAEQAGKDGLSQKEFNDKMNDSNKYQLEDPSSNRSHQYEEPRDSQKPPL